MLRSRAVPFASNRPQLPHRISFSIPLTLKVLSCAPAYRLIAFVRPSLWALNRRRKPCTMLQSSCGAVVRWSYTGPVGEFVPPPPLPQFSKVLFSGPSFAQFRRTLQPFSFSLVGAFAMSSLPERQHVDVPPGPVPHPVPRPTVTARRQGFVGPAAEKRIDELVKSYKQSFEIGHTFLPPVMGNRVDTCCFRASSSRFKSSMSSCCRWMT